MAMFVLALCISVAVSCVSGQRPSFAGTRPIGFPELYDRPTTEALGNRFGENNGTTPRLPLEAQGDRELVDRLSKLPIDQQPFWLINWQALEANRQKPQTYPQKPNDFVDNASPNPGGNQNSANINTSPNANPSTSNRNNFNAGQNLNNGNRFNTPTRNTNVDAPQIKNPNLNAPGVVNNVNSNTQASKPAVNSNANLDNKKPISTTVPTVGSKLSVTQVTKINKNTVTNKPVKPENNKPSDYSDEYGSVEYDASEEVKSTEKPKLDKFVALI